MKVKQQPLKNIGNEKLKLFSQLVVEDFFIKEMQRLHRYGLEQKIIVLLKKLKECVIS